MNSQERLEKIISLMERDDSIDAPQDSLRWAKNLFAVRSAEPSTLQRWIAVLVSELAPGRPAFGERSAAAGKARQLLYQAGDAAVEVVITPRGKAFELKGQFLGEFQEGSSAVLSSADSMLECRLSELGGFTFEKVAKGNYDLVVRTEAGEFAVEGLAVG